MKDLLDSTNIPQHVAIIMDGNGRWAKKKGALRIFGHNQAVKSVKEATEAASEIGIKYLTLYAFSTENWNRPAAEVNALMKLLVDTIKAETPRLAGNNIKLTAIGNLNHLPEKCQEYLKEGIEATKNNTGLNLILALSYSGKWEILDAINSILKDFKENKLPKEEIDENLFRKYLKTSNIPDPELLIRTSGEIRISNFLLWQAAYSELYFTNVLWPDFRKDHFFEAIISYQKRERRFGKISEQIRNVS